MVTFQEDPSVCLYCGWRAGSTHNMCIHLLTVCLVVENHPYDVVKCPCGKWSYGASQEILTRETLPGFKFHVCGRKSPGILDAPLTLEEIRDHLWTSVQSQLLGVKP